ncbi:MAG: hypothetical protein E7163_04195 [Firmicutes bacterium]|nr:hypothetical protein [Bacillota bacterium]
MTLSDVQIKAIIDSFVEIYGEENRTVIDSKIRNCLILLCGYKPIEELNEIRTTVNQKYLEQFIGQIKSKTDLSDNDIKLLFENDMFKKYSLIESFGVNAQEIIDAEPKNRMQQFQTKQILKAREEFYNMSDTKDILPELADELGDLYIKYASLAKKELLELSLNYEENKEKIAGKQFLEDVNFDLSFYDFEDQQHNGVQPNFVLNSDGETVLYPIVSFSTVKRKMEAMFGAEDYFDVLLIHELNHIIGMHLLDYKGKSNYQLQMGILISDTEKNTTKYYFASMIDEIFNQKVAKEVTKKLHSKGIYLIDNPNKSRIEDTSLYEMGEFLLVDFFSDYFDKLLQIYASGEGLEELYQEIGSENVKELGLLIEEFLNKSNEDELSDTENKYYQDKSKDIYDKISGKNEKEKLVEVVKVLDLNNLESITEDDIKQAYNSILNKYVHSIKDLNIKNELVKQLNEYLEFALSNVSKINDLDNSATNLHVANMYNVKKSNVILELNNKKPEIINSLITSLYNSEFSFMEIMIFLNSIEYGLVTPKIAYKIVEIYGDEFYQGLISINEVEENDVEKRNQIINNMEAIVVGGNSPKPKNK